MKVGESRWEVVERLAEGTLMIAEVHEERGKNSTCCSSSHLRIKWVRDRGKLLLSGWQGGVLVKRRSRDR